MTPESNLVELVAGLVVVPWCVFVTTSLFNQRQEIALMKQSHDDLKGMLSTLIKILKKDGIST